MEKKKKNLSFIKNIIIIDFWVFLLFLNEFVIVSQMIEKVNSDNMKNYVTAILLVLLIYSLGILLNVRNLVHELKHKIEPYLGKPYYATAGDETVSGINPDIPQIFSEIYNKESRVAKYDEFCKLGELDQAAEYSKLLDEAIAIKEEKALAEKLAEEKRIKEELAKKEAHKKAITELLDKYSLTTESEKSTEHVKRKWWQKFF